MGKFAKPLIIALIIVSFISGFILGGFLFKGGGEKFPLLEETRSIVKRWFVGKSEINDRELEYGAIRGMVSSLGDPHSAFLTPDERKRMEEAIEGEFEGVGIIITIKDGVLTVVSPIEGSPAWRAGIKEGDKILEINGESTLKMTLTEAALKIRGKRGTKVRLKIMRGDETFTVEITRDVIILKAVSCRMIGDIGYIKIEAFRERIYEEFKKSLSYISGEGAKALILDLRNNQGGLLYPAIKVISEFIDEGELAVYAIDGDGRRHEWRTGKGEINPDIPLVVLVNRGTASASEIVAGALKDYNRAIIIGEKTFGKGTINSLFPLSDGSAVYLSYARWFTPKGHSIEAEGITPDLKVEDEKALDEAISYLRKVLEGKR